MNLFAITLTSIATIIGAFGAIFLKIGSKRISLFNVKLLFGLSLYGIATIIYIIALKQEKLSVLYPIISMGYIWVILLSARLLKEKINKDKWLGILFIILGVIFIGFGS